MTWENHIFLLHKCAWLNQQLCVWMSACLYHAWGRRVGTWSAVGFRASGPPVEPVARVCRPASWVKPVGSGSSAAPPRASQTFPLSWPNRERERRTQRSDKSTEFYHLKNAPVVVVTDLQLRCDDSLILDGQNVGSWAQHRRRPIQEPLNVPQSSLGPVFRLKLINQLIGQQICSVITPSLGLKVKNTCISPTVMSLIGLFLFPR